MHSTNYPCHVKILHVLVALWIGALSTTATANPTQEEANAQCQAWESASNQNPTPPYSYHCVDVGIIGYSNGWAVGWAQTRYILDGIEDCYLGPTEWMSTPHCAYAQFSGQEARFLSYTSISKSTYPPCGVGNPIDPASGLKCQRESVFEVPGFSFVLTYRSDDGVPTGPFGASRPGFGIRWSTDFGNRIYFQTTSSVAAFRPGGQVLIFSGSGNNYTSNGEKGERLQGVVDGANNLVGWVYSDANDLIENYDATGRLTTITTREGATKSLAYSDGTAIPPNGGTYVGTSTPLPAGLLVGVADAYGRKIAFAYDASNKVVQVTDPAGNPFQFGYEAAGNLTTITFSDTKQRQFLYNEAAYTGGASLPRALTGIIDENGQRFATYAYDSLGRVVSSEHAGGVEKHSVSYGPPSNSAVVTDPLGTQRTYLFTGILQKPFSITQPCTGCGYMSASRQYYDSGGNPTIRFDFNNNRTNYSSDVTRNLETQRVEALTGGGLTTPATRTTTTQWHAAWRLPATVAEPKRITTYVYNGDLVSGSPLYCAPPAAMVNGIPIGVLCSKTVQETTDSTGAQGFSATLTGTPRVWQYTYDSYGKVLNATNPNGKTTSTTYYAINDPDVGKRGNVWTITNPLQHVTTVAAYDGNGRPLSTTDPNNVVTTLTYHPRGWLTSRTAGGETTIYDYDFAGQLSKVTRPDSSYVQYTYDPAHRLTQLQDGLGNKVVYTLDNMGNRIKEEAKDPSNTLARVRQQVFDNLNQLHQSIGAQ